MSPFVLKSISSAGLLPVLAAHRAGNREVLDSSRAQLEAADLLVLGAVADALRVEDVGLAVNVHERLDASAGVHWVEPVKAASELDFLRAVAIARIVGSANARIGVDWSQCGMELAQVALGFGASDLRGPITRKSGLPIYEDEKRKVKGQGMVELRSIKIREIALLITHAGRTPHFVEAQTARAVGSDLEVARV